MRAKRTKTNELMTVKEYNRKKEKAKIKFLSLDLNPNNCLFLTLTIADKKYDKIEMLNEKFKNLKDQIRKQTHCEMLVIKIFELQKETKNLHIHAILQFSKNSKLISKQINNEWIAKHWNLGTQCKIMRVYDVYPLLLYLVKRLDEEIICIDEDENLDYNMRRTPFVKGTHIVTVTQGFPKRQKQSFVCTEEQYSKFKASIGYSQLFVQAHGYNGMKCVDCEGLLLKLEGNILKIC